MTDAVGIGTRVRVRPHKRVQTIDKLAGREGTVTGRSGPHDSPLWVVHLDARTTVQLFTNEMDVVEGQDD